MINMFCFKKSFCYIILILYEVNARDDIKQLSKRQDLEDYRMCAQNFEIHQDKIIRTEESKRMGAEYLNGKDVTNKDDCIKFCCQTPNCNVFVLEEKVFNQQLGTCYLFECGTPDNFKCKFTRHHNYSSAVLIINRPQIQLEDEIQYTQHERELTNLRIGENITKTKNCLTTTKADLVEESVRAKETKELSKLDDGNRSFRKTTRCSRYQFECRTSAECIAIYNVCDGIPQCADHSDEDSELGCPTNAPIIAKKPEENQNINKHSEKYSNRLGEKPPSSPSVIHYPKDKLSQDAVPDQIKNPSMDQNFINRESLTRQYKMNQWQSRMNQPLYNSANRIEIPINENYQGNTNVDPRMVLSSHQISAPNYGREGELIDGNTWSAKNPDNHIFKQNYGPLHNFNHKQNEINIPYNYGELGNVGMNSPYDKYNNGYFGSNYYQINGNSWRQKLPIPNYEDEHRFADPKNFEISRNRAAPEYFYEDTNGSITKVNEPQLVETESPKIILNATVKAANETKLETTIPTIKMFKSTTQTVKNLMDATTRKIKKESSQTLAKEVEEKIISEPNSHRKLEKQFSAEVLGVREQLLDANIMDGYTEQPNGAFISLTLGLSVTAVMVFVVGCRLKVVRKRIRRVGKASYAHDADFLVNGMYL